MYMFLLLGLMDLIAWGCICTYHNAEGAQTNITTMVLLCRAFIPRYFYNDTAQQCEMFIYGGCGGNDNNFETAGECRQNCSGIYFENHKSLQLYTFQTAFGGFTYVWALCVAVHLYHASTSLLQLICSVKSCLI